MLDDLDRAGRDVRAALDALPAGPGLVVATARESGTRADATLRLAPLDAQAVRAIAGLYGPRAAEAPVERLLSRRRRRARTSTPRGPGVGARAMRRGGSARRPSARPASGPSCGRPRHEVAGGVEALQAVREREPEIVACPFKGLASFDVDDAGVFFGRERLVAELVARLAGAPLMAIVGPSGSGKSSVLRAGLLAALAGGVLPGSERWPIALLRPGEHPLSALEHATAGLDGRSCWPSTSSRSCSPPAATRPSERRSRTRSPRAPATRCARRSC